MKCEICKKEKAICWVKGYNVCNRCFNKARWKLIDWEKVRREKS